MTKKTAAKKPAPHTQAKKVVKAAPPAKDLRKKLVAVKKPVAAKPAPVKKVEPKKVEPKKAVIPPPDLKKVVELKKIEVKKVEIKKIDFSPKDFVVYPTHGVGRILRLEKIEISGAELELFVVEFEKDKMTLRVPIGKAQSVGMRRLSTPQKMKTALQTLKGRARIKRAMWSRRAQEYEAKINSGDPIAIAEVVRDLHRNSGQPDQSYSERQIYEAARDRLVRELAAVERIDEGMAVERLEKVLRAA